MKNKFAIVTGASTGIGRATAIELGRNGATVALVARSKQKLEETKKLVEKAGGTAIVFETDLSNIDSINNLIQSIKKQTQQVDILVNIAGVWHDETNVFAGVNIEDIDQKIIRDTFNVGIIAPIILAKGILPMMKKGSNILNLSGTFIYGGKQQIPYYVSKRAIEDFTVALSDELRDRKIYVNCISPADTLTDAYKNGFPDDINEPMNSVGDVAMEIIKIINSNKTKQFVLIRNGQTEEGFHK